MAKKKGVIRKVIDKVEEMVGNNRSQKKTGIANIKKTKTKTAPPDNIKKGNKVVKKRK